MSTEFEMNENTHCETGLTHGQFNVNLKDINGKHVRYVVSSLKQEEIADGWSMILPKAHKNPTKHHFCVYLSQLPPHLWQKVKVDSKKNDTYQEISDNIYKYSVKISKYDNDIRKLYTLVMAKYPNVEQVSEQFKVLQSARVRGWVMIKAHNILHPSKKY